jgi:hypothetical protein
MAAVFISYRRDDSEGQARALFRDLSKMLGEGAVFMDVDAIAPGHDFREVLQELVAASQRGWPDDAMIAKVQSVALTVPGTSFGPPNIVPPQRTEELTTDYRALYGIPSTEPGFRRDLSTGDPEAWQRYLQQPNRSIEEVIETRGFARKNEDGRSVFRYASLRKRSRRVTLTHFQNALKHTRSAT